MLRSKVKAEEHAMAVHERGEIPPLTKREEKSKSSIAVQHQPLLQDSNSKLLKEIMEKVEKLDIKVENMSKGGKGKWWPKQKSTSRQRSGKGAIRKRFPLQKPRWEKKQTNNQALIP